MVSEHTQLSSGERYFGQPHKEATDLRSPTLSVCEAVMDLAPLLSVEPGACPDLYPDPVSDLRLRVLPESSEGPSIEM